jgi:hypothetical protein
VQDVAPWHRQGAQATTRERYYPLDVILLCVRWCGVYVSRLRSRDEMMAERRFKPSHSTVHRRVIRLAGLFGKVFCQHMRPVGRSWRMDETWIQVRGSGGACTARRPRPAIRSIFCCEPVSTRLPCIAISRGPSTRTANAHQDTAEQIHQVNGGFQDFSRYPRHPVRHRGHASDEKRVDGRHCHPTDRSREILFSSDLSSSYHIGTDLPDHPIATQPGDLLRIYYTLE